MFSFTSLKNSATAVVLVLLPGAMVVLAAVVSAIVLMVVLTLVPVLVFLLVEKNDGSNRMISLRLSRFSLSDDHGSKSHVFVTAAVEVVVCMVEG